MGWTDLILRLRALRSPRRAEQDLDDELKFHLEMEARKAQRHGLSDQQAQQRARAEFGGVEQVRETCRDVRGLTVIENLARDLRYGIRVLGKTPGFTAIAILSLAIGIGANTAIFSLVDTVLLRTLPVRNPEQLVILKWSAKQAPTGMHAAFSSGEGRPRFRTNVVSWDIFSEIRRRSQKQADLFGFSPAARINVTTNGEARIAGGMLVSGNYFSGLGVPMLLGRPILDDDDLVDGVPAVVISYRFWEKAFGMDPEVIGKPIYVNRLPCVVVGVTPRAYFGVSPGGFMLTPEIEVSMPIRMRDRLDQTPSAPRQWFAHDWFWIQVMARMHPGSNWQASAAEMGAELAQGLPEAAIRDQRTGVPQVELINGGKGLESLRLQFREPLLILLGVVGMALLMTCANLAGLLLAKATARRKEIALRLALGAKRGRVIRQLLAEGALLSIGGAVAGLLLADWSVHGLQKMLATGQVAFAFEVHPDLRILAFTAAVALLTTVLFGLVPALRTTRIDLSRDIRQDVLHESGHRQFGPARLLLAAQIAIALVLVAGAALFTRSLSNLRAIPLGFNAQRVVMFGLNPGSNGYDETRGNQLYANVLDRMKKIPSVTGATMSVQTPLSGFSWSYAILLPGSHSPRYGDLNLVGPDFFDVMQLPVVLGRGIDVRDSATSPRVAVISETAARTLFSGSPLGQRFRWDSRPEWEVEVVGVVKDAKYNRLRRQAAEVIYVPYQQASNGFQPGMHFELRTAGDSAAVIAAMRSAVREFDRMLPLVDVQTMEGLIDEGLAQERLFASVVGLFGTITLVLACVGIYGLVSYGVGSRTREIGVRVALGAGRAAVLRMVLGQVAVTTVAGLVAGAATARAVTKLIQAQLYGVTPQDPIAIAAAALAVLGIAILAAFLPARRAMKIDPMSALRYE